MSTEQYLSTIRMVLLNKILFVTEKGIHRDPITGLFYFEVTIFGRGSDPYRGKFQIFFLEDLKMSTIEVSYPLKKFLEIIALCEWDWPTAYNWNTSEFDIEDHKQFQSDLEAVISDYLKHLKPKNLFVTTELLPHEIVTNKFFGLDRGFVREDYLRLLSKNECGPSNPKGFEWTLINSELGYYICEWDRNGERVRSYVTAKARVDGSYDLDLWKNSDFPIDFM